MAFSDLSADDIIDKVRGDLWKKVLIFPRLDSTNEFAVSTGGLTSGTVIIADEQTRGRGRLGRRWLSPPGLNIYTSLILRPDLSPCDAPLLTVLAAVSCAVALRDISGLPVYIKWPNDLMVGGKKIGGILTETRLGSGRIKYAVIGIGVNVNMGKGDFPEELRAASTSLRIEVGRHWGRTEIVSLILREFESGYRELCGGGRQRLLQQARELSCTIGRDVLIMAGNECLVGSAEDIDENGMLVVRLQSGDRKHISAGDVTLLR